MSSSLAANSGTEQAPVVPFCKAAVTIMDVIPGLFLKPAELESELPKGEDLSDRISLGSSSFGVEFKQPNRRLLNRR